jgi:hypothetical protein
LSAAFSLLILMLYKSCQERGAWLGRRVSV